MIEQKEVKVYCKSASCKHQGNGLLITFSVDVKEGLAVSVKPEKQLGMGGRRLLRSPPPRYRKEYISILCILSCFCFLSIRDKFAHKQKDTHTDLVIGLKLLSQ